MYRSEVPLYGDLVQLVDEVNAGAIANHQGFEGEELKREMEENRLKVERHGAIRVGKASELHTLRRLFALMAMFPVNYYDLSVAGLPVHATAFRPITPDSLTINPFRVFTSLLRLDLITDVRVRQIALKRLEKREIFRKETIALVEKAEAQGGLLNEEDAVMLVQHAMETFRWQSDALVEKEVYDELKEAHSLVADVVAFRGPHINHLTPRTLDIDAVQARMPEKKIESKHVIEGPPHRLCPILLRQTSFQAVQEPIYFVNPNSNKPGHDHKVLGFHRARFGEIEQRGVALTPEGVALYHRLMEQAEAELARISTDLKFAGAKPVDNATRQRVLQECFTAFPESWEELRARRLAYFRYVRSSQATRRPSLMNGNPQPIDMLIDQGLIRVEPIVYEDFLPASAAGIFHSNLGDLKHLQVQKSGPDREGFEQALGEKVVDGDALYQAQQLESMTAMLESMRTNMAALKKLGQGGIQSVF
ncbi:hypothetical protein QFC22_005937 [Naganishia vaughanmartiniae]|uniref:Uncharacterized protein n=1 Tax=Naganishia vaughanmartiniae TaxID=1424756 RepID=A0ACC2WQX8_9TREE|nr:hypothetical protein QFC22_005937 [Naganishia vaughanmartiniae]